MFVSSVRDQCADDAAAADNDVDKDQVRTVLIELGLLGDMCSSRRLSVVCSRPTTSHSYHMDVFSAPLHLSCIFI